MTGSGLSKGPHSGAGAPPRRKDEAGGGRAPQSRVRAAGGVVWRRVPSGIEVVLVHRPAYDDWALPKGKAEGDETDEQTALREVREETGLTCRLGPELPSTTYADGEGRAKVVRYWAMTVVPGTFDVAGGKLAPEPKARREIDDLYWAPVQDARRRLTYPYATWSCSTGSGMTWRVPVPRTPVPQMLGGNRSTRFWKANHSGTRQIRAPSANNTTFS